MASHLEKKFALFWASCAGPELVRELRFYEKRRFRFDFAHLATRTAIELEGGVWTKGAHNRGKHFSSDCEKYNLAALRGWTVFRLTTDMITVKWVETLVRHVKERMAVDV